MNLSNLVAEVNAAVAAGDLPRAERAAFDLRTRFGISIVWPIATQPRYSPYRVAADPSANHPETPERCPPAVKRWLTPEPLEKIERLPSQLPELLPENRGARSYRPGGR